MRSTDTYHVVIVEICRVTYQFVDNANLQQEGNGCTWSTTLHDLSDEVASGLLQDGGPSRVQSVRGTGRRGAMFKDVRERRITNILLKRKKMSATQYRGMKTGEK